MNYVELFNSAKPGYRVCSVCLKEKPLSAFYSDGTNKAGEKKYRRNCKECYKVSREKAKEVKKIHGTGKYYK